MRVRLGVGLAGVLGASVALLALSGCTVKDADDGAAGGGGSAGSSAGGSAGSSTGGSTAGGSAGSSTGGSTAGGSAGTGSADLCAGIPTSGKCDGNKVVLCQQPPPGAAGDPTVVTNDCGANYTCTDPPDGSGAFCKLKGACVPGETRCTGDNKAVEVCKADGTGFGSTPCPAQETCTSVPGKAASCEAQPQAGGTGTATDTLKGCISFERKGLSTTGPTAIGIEPAVLQFVAVYNGDEYIGYGITGAADGCFVADLAKPATADTTVYVFAMDFDPETNQPLVAVAHYPGDDGKSLPKTSTEYWNWSNKQDGCGDGLKAAVVPNKDGAGKHVLGTVDHDGDTIPDMLIPEVCGSGAIRIFQWTRFGMVRLGKDHYGLDTFANGGKQRDIVTATEQLKQDSIAVYWEKGKDVACGACFSNKGNGPFHIDPAGEIDDLYDTAIYISGTEQNPTQWSYSVLSHELGHWVMANYSLSPGEGGQHFVGQASKPGLAYSEGWATSFGQWNSSFAGEWDPVYIDVQDGTTFHVDIEKGTYSGGNLVRPNKEDSIDQFINENVVAGMLFKLNADGAGATKNITGGQGLGPDALFKAFIAPRVKNTSLNRGYSRVDLVDFFDSARCSEAIPNTNISAVSDEVTYPWDGKPNCN